MQLLSLVLLCFLRLVHKHSPENEDGGEDIDKQTVKKHKTERKLFFFLNTCLGLMKALTMGKVLTAK